ncbi:hypothetical protein EA187_10310 [Lujinxingia sediminis]|uniref:Tetratricopeptide repeat protein n=1 Tax=Lujinxingia sediminis TaxID=2480984 RepID=A0ABY0CTK0_9DELT|nr:hypothetical protein [Lujinxingia sediminis]RVU44921.1 hypothetical protein EA187_10310 [Lujinxingia sediminis]
MIRRELQALSSPQFQHLAAQCGLELSEVDFSQLSRRKLLAPFDAVGGYTRLHLFVLAQYLEAVRPVRHPWGSRAAERTLDEVAELGRELEAIFEGLIEGHLGDERLSRAERVFRELERFLASCDPFGPLGEVIDLLNPGFVAKLRNQGRLYAELRGASRALAEAIQGGESKVEREPMTRPMFQFDVEAAVRTPPVDDLRSTQVIDEVMETSRGAREAIDEVLSAASEVSEHPGHQDDEDDDDDDFGEATQILKAPNAFRDDDLRSTQVIEVSLDDIDVIEEDSDPSSISEASESSEADEEEGELSEQSSEPIVLTEEKSAPGEAAGPARAFRRASQPTERTRDLNERLARLRSDLSEAEEPPPPAVESGEVSEEPTAPTEDLAARIAILNEQRERYIKEQAWEELAALYEDGIELFSAPAERQQVFLVLAMLYEVKLRQKEQAFDAFARAFAERRAEAGRAKALEGLQRLGRAASLHQRYVEWIQTQLSTPLDDTEREGLQKELSLALFSDRQYQKAFLCYASFLADDPERNINPGNLAQLSRLGEYVESDEVAAFYQDLLEQKLSTPVAGLLREHQQAMLKAE